MREKRKQFDSVLWQKPLHPQKNPKSNMTTQKRYQKSSIPQRLRTDLGRSVGVTTVTRLVWFNRLTSAQPSHLPTTDDERLLFKQNRCFQLGVRHPPPLAREFGQGKGRTYLFHCNMIIVGRNLTSCSCLTFISHAADCVVYQFCKSTFDVCEISRHLRIGFLR